MNVTKTNTSPGTRCLAFSRQAVALFIIVTVVCGCGGPSTEDLLYKSARRKRASSETDKAEKKPESPKEVVSEAVKPAEPEPQPAEVPSARLSMKEESPDEAVGTEEQAAGLGVEQKPTPAPIEERWKELKLGEAQQKNEWAYQGLTSIGQAIEACKKDRKFALAHKNSVGVETLSWRVLILPYLGYQELYDKFDLEKAWYLEPNKSLLKHIPNEFVSPERGDTKTSFVLPVQENYMFGRLALRFPRDVRDTPAETIMLMEANDQWAIEWSAPGDFDAGREPRKQLKGVRAGGVFALWGDGTPFLLSDSAPSGVLNKALEYNEQQPPMNAQLQKPIPVGAMMAASTASDQETIDPDMESPGEVAVPLAEVEIPALEVPIDFSDLARKPVPKGVALQAASEKLRTVFKEDLDGLKTDEDRSEFGAELLEHAKIMDELPAEKYVVYMAVEGLAIEAGDAELLIDALDQRVAHFELDPYETNVERLAEFAGKHLLSSKDEINGPEQYSARALHVMLAGFKTDDYGRSQRLIRLVRRWYSHEDSPDTTEKIDRLRSLLGAAYRVYEDSKESLSTLRIDPDNDEAAQVVGRFLCFFKADWEAGLPLLARTTNEDLAKLIKADIANPTAASEQLELADQWWTMGDRTTNAYRQAARDRAKHWYVIVLPELKSGLDRLHVEGRLQEHSKAAASSPITVMRELADEFDVDLTLPLAAVIRGTSTSKSRDDKDRD
ncbi:hypothetical protein SV7mr_04740 [Stieleria bergensis]|uniref:DUF1559 domain-containing protein n=1 Tax=Stieleria bergensis TaxID=2528025 RepID=A0A517SPD8_9BACT|nr:hypothetical protein SV7mr_04740 [Planctomycetes bacterium SV_7m_r]